MGNLFKSWNQISLILRIIVGLAIGTVLGALVASDMPFPDLTWISIFGTLFVGALKAIAPILVFFLVMSALSLHKSGQQTNMKSVVLLYAIGTFSAALIAVIASFAFPVELILTESAEGLTPPQNIVEVINGLLISIVDNPVKAIYNANFIAVLFWAILFGLALRGSSDNTKKTISDVSDALSNVVQWIISFAPFGIMGLIFSTVSVGGLEALLTYAQLLAVLLGTMFFIALIVNPLIVFIYLRKNPYPLVFRCLLESGITAFFTRSSAANIPVNLKLCNSLGLDKDTYSVSIPLGATVNMAGAAVTITVLTLAAVHTLGIPVDLPTALLLSIVAAISAAGASGVAGGSLLLIPLACSMFGIPNDIAMQVVGVGFIIGVLQDSCETALNSSSDVLFTATADYAHQKRDGKQISFAKVK